MCVSVPAVRIHWVFVLLSFLGYCSTGHDQLESASHWKWQGVEGGGA
jgi:hypothetical protein